MEKASHSYWLQEPLLNGTNSTEEAHSNSDIVIVGSGLTGTSIAYWLLKNHNLKVTLLDKTPSKAATNRNCGHILHGTVETIQTMEALHGKESAKSLWQFSINICEEVKSTINELNLECEYQQDGYLVIAIDEQEDRECQLAVKTLNDYGFSGESYLSQFEVEKLGFKSCYGARYETGSAQAHPVKFRNGLLKHLQMNPNFRFNSETQVLEIDDSGESTLIKTDSGTINCEIAILATNSYSPLISPFIKSKNLIEPYKGQIITSKVLTEKIPISYPHSFDHGYIYSLRTADNRLMIGGWRNHTDGQYGIYDLEPNTEVEQGLKQFVKEHYSLKEEVEWDFSWSGIMGSAKGGLPLIGPTSSHKLWTCSGFTGHGFSWAHGSAKMLAELLMGTSSQPKAFIDLFNPNR